MTHKPNKTKYPTNEELDELESTESLEYCEGYSWRDLQGELWPL